MFELTDKQREARELLNSNTETLLYGGSRSGKTAVILRNIIIRALKRRSRHLIARKHFNHARVSILLDSLPKIFASAFPGLPYHIDRKDWFVRVGDSEIWVAGLDDKERTEKILGTEYSTIFLEEASQISVSSVGMVKSRLAENSGLDLRLYIACNPPSRRHWVYKDHVLPGKPSLLMNPVHNVMNLPADYLQILQGLPSRQRLRFLEGKFLDDIEGALWTTSMIDIARTVPFDEPKVTVIGVDPSVTGKTYSNSAGIIVAARDKHWRARILADKTVKATPKLWAQQAINAYHVYNANAIVVETNQGGDMVKTIIHNIDRSVKVVPVWSKHGKIVRAEPVAALYEQEKVSHVPGLADLEEEMTTYSPLESNESPDRLDAMVIALSYLMLGKKGQFHVA